MNYLDEWSADVLTRKARTVPAPVRVEGERKAHLGPRLEFARVRFVVEPADTLDVSVEAPDFDTVPGGSAFAHAAVLGFLDVVLLADPQPVRNIRLRLVDADVDPVSSSVAAFRRAGRAAGERLIEVLRTPR